MVIRGRVTAVLPRTMDQDTTAILHNTIQNPTAIQDQEDITTLPHHTTQNLMVIPDLAGNIEFKLNLKPLEILSLSVE
jgi:hypothetical protein